MKDEKIYPKSQDWQKIIERSDLSLTAIGIYLHLCKHKGTPITHLLESSSDNLKTVEKGLKELQKTGLIERR